MNRSKPLIIAALALCLAVPAAQAKSFKVKAGPTVVKHVHAPSEGRLVLSAARSGCSRSVRIMVKRRGKVVLRGRLNSKRAKVLKGTVLAAGRHRLTVRVKGPRRSKRCNPPVSVKRLWVEPAVEDSPGVDDPPDPEDDDGQNGPDDNGEPPPALPGEEDEQNEDADA